MNNFLKNKMKKLIILFIITLLLVCCVIVFLNIKQNKEEREYLDSHPNTINKQKMSPNNLNTSEFFTLKSCIELYYGNVYRLGHNDNPEVKMDKEYKEKQSSEIMVLLNKDFVSEYEIDNEKIIKLFDNYKFNRFLIEKSYLTETDNGISIYIVYGKEINEETNKSRDYALLVSLDSNNGTYSVAPYEYLKNKEIDESTTENELLKKIKYDNIVQDKEKRNTYTYAIVYDEDLVNYIYKEFKQFTKYNSKYSIELLDDDYKNKKFNSIDEGTSYLNKNILNIYGNKLVKMNKDTSDPYYTRYVCLDNNGNYFIIKKDDQLMKYSIILDIYTIPVKEVTEKYNNSNNAQKTAINIEKFKQMINLKDYNSAYNVLDETFRNNNFGSVEKFEKYIKQNWPEYISIKCSNYNEVNDVGTMDIKITERGVYEEELNRVIEKTFIVKLLDENNFVMSFNVDE